MDKSKKRKFRKKKRDDDEDDPTEADEAEEQPTVVVKKKALSPAPLFSRNMKSLPFARQMTEPTMESRHQIPRFPNSPRRTVPDQMSEAMFAHFGPPWHAHAGFSQPWHAPSSRASISASPTCSAVSIRDTPTGTAV